MTHDPSFPDASRVIADGHVHSGASYVDWAAILAGAVFAAALSFIMLGFGAAVGLSMASPYEGESASAMWFTIAAGLWFVWVMVSSFGAGGYLSGRMRHRAGDATPAEVETRDGAHGLMVWAVGALLGMLLAASGVSGLASIGGAAAGKAAEIAAEADVGYYANLMLRGAEIDPAAQLEIGGIVARGVAEGGIVERDRAYVATMIASRAGLDEAAARARVDQAIAEIDAARATALAAAERARIAAVLFGFVTAATLMACAAAAFFTATLGGRHRDEGLGFDALPVHR